MAKQAAKVIRCPRCIRVKMLDQVWSGAKISICMNCGANFFHAGDLAVWEGWSADLPVGAEKEARHAPAHVHCPACDGEMEHVEFGTEPPLEVERCLSCHGLLLDFDEVRRMPQIAKWAASKARAGSAR